jgi:hypothetical protein
VSKSASARARPGRRRPTETREDERHRPRERSSTYSKECFDPPMLLSRQVILRTIYCREIPRAGSVRREKLQAVTLANRMWLVARSRVPAPGLQGATMSRTYTAILR